MTKPAWVYLVALASLMMGGSLVLGSCGRGNPTGPSTSDATGSAIPQTAANLPKDLHLFTKSGVWVAPQSGTYMVGTVGGGGGGGGAGSACDVGGIPDQVEEPAVPAVP